MGAKAEKVNRVKNGCSRNDELNGELQKIQDSDTTGPGAGLGPDDPFHVLSVAACIEHAVSYGTQQAVADAAEAIGELVGGLELAEGITAKQARAMRSAAVAKLADQITLDDGSDAYDVANSAFERGLDAPRDDLAETAKDQRRSQRATTREAETDAERRRVAGQVAFVTEACERARNDAGALFEASVFPPVASLRDNAPAEFQRLRAKIKEDLGADVLKEWEKALGKHDAAKREEAKRQELLNAAGKSAFAAKGGRAGDAAKECDADEEPWDDRSAHEFGTDQDFDPTDERMCGKLLRLMNRDYAVVSIGGDFRILEVTLEGRVTLHRLEALRQKFENIRVPVPGKAQLANSFDVWMRWPERATYEGIGFYPGSPKHPPVVPKGHFNTWRGFAVKSHRGTWPLLFDHILDVYCGGDDDLLCWLLDWVAQLIQEPQRKCGTSVVLRSRTEGTGKSLFAHVMRKILGSSVLSASRSDQVAGRFNSHLQNTLLLVAEEAVYAGSKQANGILKDLITCPEMAYEAKGLPVVFAPNYTRVIFISNEAHVVSAGPTSRRFAFFDCENARANDPAYFGPLFAEIDNGGAEAFANDMLKRKITSDLRMPPITKGLLEQREMSVDGFGRWLLSAAKSGQVRIPDSDGSQTVELSVAVDQGAYISFDDLRASAKPYLDQFEQRAADHKLGALLKSVGARKVKLPKSENPSRPWGYEFPPLAEFRKAVGQQLGVVVEPDVDEDGYVASTKSKASKVVPFNAAMRAAKTRRASSN